MTSFRPYLLPFSKSDISLLALSPLFVAGMATPIVDADGGIGLGVVEDDDQGALCVIDPWYGMQEGDTVDVYLDANKVFHHEVKAQEVNERLFFFLPAERFMPDWIEECFYVLQRKSEVTPDDPSPALRLRVKLDRPAGDDKEPHKPGHSELKMVQLPDEVIRQGVDAEWAAKGVPMTILRYPNIALRDVVQVKWGSVFLKPLELTTAHVDGTQPIVITAEQADILAAGDSNALLVQYEVHDEVWNYSEKWSISTTVKVDAGAWRLEAPIIKEAVNGVIDLKILNQQDVTVQIHVRTDDFDIGDTLTMTWIGTPQVGKPLIHTQSRTITNVPSILELKVPYEEVRAIAMGSADTSYVLTKKNGGPPLSSKRTFADVIGDVYAHPAPVIREVVGDILEPDTQIATVDVSYPGMAEGDFLDLIWVGTQSDGRPYVHQEEYTVSQDEAGRKLVSFYIPGEHISVLANGRLDLWYRVSNDKSAVFGVSDSEHLLVKVQAIAATLPAPKVPEADENDVLDPSKVFNKVTVLVDYLGTVKGDTLTYYWTSPNPSTSTSDWLPITTVSAGKPVPFRVDTNFVASNIGQYIKVRYTLKRAATGLYSYSATRNVLIGYLVGELPPPEVIQAPDGVLDPIKALAGVDIKVSYESMDPALDIIRLKWLGTPGPGTSEDQEKPGDQSHTVKFHLDASVVGPNINRMVRVSYGVKRYGYESPSETLNLQVLGFQDPENELPRPEVPQAVARVLDLMEFTGNADALVKKWPFIAPGHRLWLRLEGRTIAGAPYHITLLEGELITPEQVSDGLKESLLRTELLKLAHASPATVLCKVAYDGANDESSAVEFPALPLTVRTRYDYVTPVITKVLDTRGEVVDGGKTGDDAVTVEGTATRGETIELFNDLTQSMGTTTVGDNSVWSLKLEKLTQITYRMTAKALYDADPESSPRRTFTVVVYSQTPTIRSVTDSKGLVQPSATTYDRSVLIEGDAAAGKQVRLFDGATPIITLDVDSTSTWSHSYDNLQLKTYQLKAVALYDADPVESQPRNFTVAAHTAPRIDSVRGNGVEVPNGTDTKSTTVSLLGIVTSGYQVQIYDYNIPKHTVTAVGVNWSTTLAVPVGSHSITAKEVSTGQVSNTRSFRVISPTLPLKIANLTASPHSHPHVFAVGSGFPRTGFNGARFRINVEAGVPPYTYSSSSGVNQIDSTGTVTIRGKDQATFTVRDSSGATTAFTMQSLPLFFSTPDNYLHNYHYASRGGRLPSISQMTAATIGNPTQYIRAVGSLFGEWGNLMSGYGWPRGGFGAGQHYPGMDHYWTSQPTPDNGNFYVVSPYSGSVGGLWREWQIPCTYLV